MEMTRQNRLLLQSSRREVRQTMLITEQLL